MLPGLLLVLAALSGAPALFDRTWDFYDDDLQSWVAHSGIWEAEDDILVHQGTDKRAGLAAQPGLRFGEVVVETDLCIPEVFSDSETVWAGLLVHAANPAANGAWHDGYQCFVRANGLVELHRADGKALGAVQTRAQPLEETVRLGCAVRGTHIEVSVNGERVIETEDGACPNGEVALISFGAVAAFDNVRICGTRLDPDLESTQASPAPHAPVAALPRVALRKDGFFVKDSGARFTPRGFNHTVLAKNWHATFNIGTYDHAAMDKTLAAMEQLGANVIRVWIWGIQGETGFTGNPAARGLNSAYMENVADFLRLATKHRIYVIPVLDETPHNAYYDAVDAAASDGAAPDVTGYTRQYLLPGPIAAKVAAIRDFIEFLRDADAGLLNAVLGWSLANEIFVNYTDGPFAKTEGSVTISGKTYDLSDPEQRQRCYDDGILRWANTLADAVEAADPEALVTAGMWTSDAAGRAPAYGLLHQGQDVRVPPRPSVLGGPESKLDFIDVHVYPWDGTPTVRREMHERDAVVRPAIVGEYGVFKNKTPEEARAMCKEMLAQAYGMGYLGDLFWIWDLVGVPGQTWSAVEEGLGAYVMGLPRP